MNVLARGRVQPIYDMQIFHLHFCEEILKFVALDGVSRSRGEVENRKIEEKSVLGAQSERGVLFLLPFRAGIGFNRLLGECALCCPYV